MTPGASLCFTSSMGSPVCGPKRRLDRMTTTRAQTAVLCALALCSAQALAAQPAGSQRSSSGQSGPVDVSLLSLPPGDGPLVVRAAFHLMDINEIDDEEETFEFTGVLTLTWQDSRQAFDPMKEQVAERIYQGAYQFSELAPAWYPQVVLANESGLFDKHAVLLRVAPDGTSTLMATVNAIAEARLNLRRYPFDTQRLEAAFQILGFDTDEVVLRAEPVADLPSYAHLSIPQWTVTGLGAAVRDYEAPYVATGSVSSAIIFAIDVKRQPLFTLRLVVLPLILIVMLSWSVFWMDQAALGDRMSVSFVGVLTAVAYNIVVVDILPQISYFTLINFFLNLSLWIMCAAVVVNLRVGLLDKRGCSERGDRIDRCSRWAFPMVYFGLISGSVAVAFLAF